MIFAAFPLADALGAVLAHSHRLPGRVLKKGSVLDDAALAALRDAGRTEVIAARLEPGDVAENEAAARLAAAVDAPGIAAGRAGTGRVNLHADRARPAARRCRAHRRHQPAARSRSPSARCPTVPWSRRGRWWQRSK